MNIVYGKFGRSISFNNSKWSSTGGDSEPPTLLLKMAQRHPEDTFYLISSNDFSKWESAYRFPNIVSLTDGKHIRFDNHTYVYDKIQRLGIKMDFGIIYNGITGQNNIPGGEFLQQDGTMTKVKCLMFAEQYVAGVFYYLNQTKLPYVLLAVDPRYIPLQAVDLIHPPAVTLSQFTSEWRFRWRERLTRIEHAQMLKQEYAEIETVAMMRWKKMPKEFVNRPRNRKITIVLNEGKFIKPTRSVQIDKWIFNNFNNTSDIEIYGEWTKPYTDMPQFKGVMQLEQLKPILIDTRYTLCIPIQKDWVTAKVAEMIHFGIVPFLSDTYDTQQHLKIPEFLRCKDPSDFKRKIEYLESNPDILKQLQLKLWELYPEQGYYDGQIVIDRIYDKMKQVLENEK